MKELFDASVRSERVHSYFGRADEEIVEIIAQKIREDGLHRLLWVSFSISDRAVSKLLEAIKEGHHLDTAKAKERAGANCRVILPAQRKMELESRFLQIGIAPRFLDLSGMIRAKFILLNDEILFRSWGIHPVIWDHPTLQNPDDQRETSSWIVISSRDLPTLQEYTAFFEGLWNRRSIKEY